MSWQSSYLYCNAAFVCPRRRLSLVLGMAALASTAPGVANAGEWTTDAGLALGSYYSDNICRSRIDDKDKVVGTVRPDLSIQGEGGRLKLNLSASGEYNTLGESDIDCQGGQGQQFRNRESFVPRVSFDSELEAIEDWLWLEADASAGQNAINPFAPGGDDAINARDNTNITYQYGVGARTQRRIGGFADFLARYNYNEQYNNVGIIGDSVQHRAETSLATRPESARLSGGVYGSFTRVEFEESRQRPAFENDLASVELRGLLRLTRSWQVNGAVGEEFNDFFSVIDEDIDGTYWDAGVAWTPNSRVEIGAGYGERFFGDTPRANISYRHKRSELSLDYQRTIAFPRNLRGGRGAGFIPGDVSPDLEDLPGDPLTGNENPTFLGRGPVQNESFSLAWRFQARRTTLGLSATESQQTRFATGSNATFRNATATLSRQLGRHLSTDLRASWIERDGEDGAIGIGARNLEGWRASWGVSRTLGNSTTFTLRYSYTDQTSDGAIGGIARNDFEENRIDFTVRYAF